MATVLLRAPLGSAGSVQGPNGILYTIGADGAVAVDTTLAAQLLRAGWSYFFGDTGTVYFAAPIASELVTIVAATIPVSGTPYTIAAQPAFARKLNVRGVYSGAVAGLVVNIVGTDGRGNAVSETVNVAAASSTTFITANAYSHVTSVTPVGTVTNVTTIGVGVSTAFALQLPPNFSDLVVYKENMDGADVTVGTVDTVAGTIIPSTLPNATHNYQWWYGFNRASQ